MEFATSGVRQSKAVPSFRHKVRLSIRPQRNLFNFGNVHGDIDEERTKYRIVT